MTKLSRFLKAQEAEYYTYSDALNEIRAGRKTGHWIWYVFPQLRGLGSSWMSDYYGIEGRAEAEAYLAHPLLGKRLREITEALMLHTDRSVEEILGPVDAMKLRSCMTLFDSVSPNDIFAHVLAAFFSSRPDPRSRV